MVEQIREEAGEEWGIQMLFDKQVENIVGIYSDADASFELKYYMKLLSKNYNYPGRVVRDAIGDGLLIVDVITEDGEVFIALSRWGEDEWELVHDKES